MLLRVREVISGGFRWRRKSSPKETQTVQPAAARQSVQVFPPSVLLLLDLEQLLLERRLSEVRDPEALGQLLRQFASAKSTWWLTDHDLSRPQWPLRSDSADPRPVGRDRKTYSLPSRPPRLWDRESQRPQPMDIPGLK